MAVALDRCEILPEGGFSDEIRETVERTAASQSFGKSDQLRRLLLHLCKQALAGRQNELHEQQIGVEVFGRPRDYDPSVDGIVRTHATRLRQRLELYFSGEGSDEPIQIEVPRGGYQPRFFRHPGRKSAVRTGPESLPAPSGAAVLLTLPAGDKVNEVVVKRYFGPLMPFLSGIILASIVTGLILHVRQDKLRNAESTLNEQTDVERNFWTTLFPSKQRTRVVTGDSGLVMYETFAGREVTLPEYLTGAYRGSALSLLNDASLTKIQIARNLADRRYTSEADLRISAAIARLPEWNPSRAELIFARDLRPSDASESNLILLGSRQANPWLSIIEASVNFRLQRKPTGEFFYANTMPRPGEATTYEGRANAEGTSTPLTYGDIAFLPNPSGKGMILALGGLWVSGTEAAGQFVFSGKAFSEWLHSVQHQDGSIPAFEILIASHALDGSATRSEIVAQRVKQ